MIERLKPILIGLVLAVCVLLGAGIVGAYYAPRLAAAQSDLKAAKGQITALTLAAEARGRADAVREAKRNAAIKKAKEDNHALQEALAKHRDWADQPVPDDVARVLDGSARPASPAK